MSTPVGARPDTSDMLVVHRLFRRVFRALPTLVRGVRHGDVRRAKVVADHCAEFSTVVHHHHTGEDELLWPLLRERAPVHAELVARMTAQHERLVELLDRIDALVPRWAATAEPALREELTQTLEAAYQVLDEHLGEEERDILPLAAEHLTVEEWSRLGQRAMTVLPKNRLLVHMGYVLEVCTPEERAKLLGYAPLAGRVVYRLVGQRMYRREIDELRRGAAVPALSDA